PLTAPLPIPGERPAVPDEQLPLPGDVARGDPRTMALRYESDFVPWKPRADALCVGNAYPGDAKRATPCVAAFGVGGWLKQILVTGNRTWKTGIARLGNTPTAPEPFTVMAVSFQHAERAF